MITGSTSAKHEVVQAYGYPSDRIHVVPFGVDTERFRPSWKVRRGTVRTPGLPTSRPYVLFINSLAPRKNVGVVRDAVGMLAADGYPMRSCWSPPCPRICGHTIPTPSDERSPVWEETTTGGHQPLRSPPLPTMSGDHLSTMSLDSTSGIRTHGALRHIGVEVDRKVLAVSWRFANSAIQQGK